MTTLVAVAERLLVILAAICLLGIVTVSAVAALSDTPDASAASPVAAATPPSPSATPPPSATPAAILELGDPRSEGEGPGLVGNPLVILAAVVLLGLATAAFTIVLARLLRYR